MLSAGGARLSLSVARPATSRTDGRLVVQGERVYGYRFDGQWLDIGRPEDLRGGHRGGHARSHGCDCLAAWEPLGVNLRQRERIALVVDAPELGLRQHRPIDCTGPGEAVRRRDPLPVRLRAGVGLDADAGHGVGVVGRVFCGAYDLVHTFVRAFPERVFDPVIAAEPLLHSPHAVLDRVLKVPLTVNVHDHQLLDRPEDLNRARDLFGVLSAGYFVSSRILREAIAAVPGFPPPAAVVSDGIDARAFTPGAGGIDCARDRQAAGRGMGRQRALGRVRPASRNHKGLHTVIQPAVDLARARGVAIESARAPQPHPALAAAAGDRRSPTELRHLRVRLAARGDAGPGARSHGLRHPGRVHARRHPARDRRPVAGDAAGRSHAGRVCRRIRPSRGGSGSARRRRSGESPASRRADLGALRQSVGRVLRGRARRGSRLGATAVRDRGVGAVKAWSARVDRVLAVRGAA